MAELQHRLVALQRQLTEQDAVRAEAERKLAERDGVLRETERRLHARECELEEERRAADSSAEEARIKLKSDIAVMNEELTRVQQQRRALQQVR